MGRGVGPRECARGITTRRHNNNTCWCTRFENIPKLYPPTPLATSVWVSASVEHTITCFQNVFRYVGVTSCARAWVAYLDESDYKTHKHGDIASNGCCISSCVLLACGLGIYEVQCLGYVSVPRKLSQGGATTHPPDSLWQGGTASAK
jgi:hypothetical protein